MQFVFLHPALGLDPSLYLAVTNVRLLEFILVSMDHQRLIPRFALAILLTLVPLAAQEIDTVREADEALSRLRAVVQGEYLIKQSGKTPLGSDDFHIAAWACRQEATELVRLGGYGLRTMVRHASLSEVPRAKIDAAFDQLLLLMTSPHKEVTRSACGAIIAFDQAEVLSAKQARRAVLVSLRLAESGGFDDRHRAGRLICALNDNVPTQVHTLIGRALLDAIGATRECVLPESAKKSEREARSRALDSMKGALVATPTTDLMLAREIAALAYVDAQGLEANNFSIYDKGKCLVCLGRLLHVLEAPDKGLVFAFLLDQVRDPELCYMTTSGRRGPFFHHGTDALLHAIPHLDAAQLKAAKNAVEALRSQIVALIAKGPDAGMGFRKSDLGSIFSLVDKAIAAR